MDPAPEVPPRVRTAKTNKRWPWHYRVQMVASLLRGLTQKEQDDIAHGGDIPNKPRVLEAIYKQLHVWVKDTLKNEWTEAGDEEAVIPTSTEGAVRRQAKFWTKSFLRRGRIADQPSVGKNSKRRERLTQNLTAIKEVLLKGYTDDRGSMRLFQSLEEADQKSEEFKGLQAEQGVAKTFPGLWRQLRREFPEFQKLTMAAKKERDAKEVQV
jgi:hypothetical protein